jgi:hypothetical protein
MHIVLSAAWIRSLSHPLLWIIFSITSFISMEGFGAPSQRFLPGKLPQDYLGNKRARYVKTLKL